MDTALTMLLQAKYQAGNAMQAARTDIKSVNKEAKDASSNGLSQMQGALKSVSMISMAALVVGIGAVVAIITSAVIKAAQFDKTMNQVSTLISGDSTDAINKLKKGILELTETIPIDPNELGANAYKVVRAGIMDTKDQLNVLASSAKLAKVGMIDSAQATDMVTKAMATFNYPAKEAQHVADTLFKTMKYGKNISLTDLQAGFEQIGPIIRQAGFQMEDFNAATAVLTAHGVPASQAQMDLGKAIQALTKPSKEMQELFTKMGVKGLPDLIARGDDLGTIFKKLTSAAGDNDETLRKAGLTQKVLTAATLLGTSANKEYNSVVLAMFNGQDQLNTAFEKSKRNIQDQIALIQNKLNIFLIDLGEKILPVVFAILNKLSKLWDENKEKIMALVDQGINVAKQAFEKLMTVIRPIFDYLSKHPDVAKATLIGLAVVITTTAIPALVAMAVASIAAAAPFIILVAAVALLVLAFKNNFLGIKDFVQKVIEKIHAFKDGLQKLIQSPPVQQFLKIMKEIGEKILKNLKEAFIELVKLWNEKLQPSLQRLAERLQPFLEVLGKIGAVIGGFLAIAVGKLVEVFSSLLKPALDIIIGVLSAVIDIISGVIDFIVKLDNKIIDFVTRAINQWNQFRNNVQGVFDAIKTIITIVIEYIRVWIQDKVNAIRSFFEGLRANIEQAFNNVRDVVSNIFNNIRNIIQNVIETVRGFIQNKIDFIINAFSIVRDAVVRIFDGIKSTIQGAFNSVVGSIKSTINNIITNINNAIGSINKLIDSVNSIPGIPHIGHVGTLGYLATGGRQIEGGRYMVGENGPEIVDLPRGANVYNAGESRQMMNDQRNQSKNVNIGEVNIYNNTDFQQFKNTLDLKLG